jgi:hypothetical protein
MAENKKSFIAYVDWKDTFNALPDDKAGQLVKYLFAYVNDESPFSDDVLINAVFANIKQTLKRDLRKYEIIREKRSLAGRVSADKRQQVLTCVDKPQQTSTNSTVSDSVNDSVNDNVNDSVNEEVQKKKYSEFVLLSPVEYDKLILEHGEINTKLFIEILNNYKGSSGKKYKSDYSTILNWVIDDAKKKGKYMKSEKLIMP